MVKKKKHGLQLYVCIKGFQAHTPIVLKINLNNVLAHKDNALLLSCAEPGLTLGIHAFNTIAIGYQVIKRLHLAPPPLADTFPTLKTCLK